MTYYKDNTLFKRRDGRLHIYKRKDKKSENWYARTFIDKKQIQISSKTSNKKQAIKILEKWFDRLQMLIDVLVVLQQVENKVIKPFF